MAKSEWESTTKRIGAAIRVLAVEFPMTIRQLFYRLVSTVIITNCLADYRRVSNMMRKARMDGRVPYEWIVDRSRASYSSECWDNLEQLAATMEYTLVDYRRNYWQDQPDYVEIVCEKDAVTGSIEEVREEYGLRVEAIRGFDSLSKVREVAMRMLKKERGGKRVTIFYLGDHDPSGKDIERDLGVRLRSSIHHAGLDDLRIERLAIFESDIAKFNLPPLRVKPSDPRTRSYLRKYGDRAVELDALPPTELRARLRHAIADLIDHEAWNRAKVVEEAQRNTCVRYANLFREMAQGK